MRVMSYNLRFDNPKDGRNAWPNRLEAVKQVWDGVNADIVGIQEGLPHQVEAIAKWFPEYVSLGQGRDKNGAGERVSIFYKRDRFECIEHGDFWLSATPEIPASKSFGNDVCRLATWALLVERDSQKRFLYLNTHLDHESENARVKGAQLICDFISRQQDLQGVVLTGDLNAIPNSDPIKVMEKEGNLLNALQVAGASGPTFHNFMGIGLWEIDFVFVSKEFRVTDARIVKDMTDGHYPSDHFPIYADLQW